MRKIGSGKKVVVAMSGGVDSSVAAALLLEQGFEVVGCFMRLGGEDSVEERPSPQPPTAAGLRSPERRGGGEASNCKVSHGPVAVNPKTGNRQGCCSVNDSADARLVAAILGVPFYVLNFKRDFGRIMDYFVAEYNAGRTPNPCVRCNDWLKFGKLADYARSIDADYIASGHYARIDRAGDRVRLLRGVDHHKDQSYVLMGMKREQLERMLLPIGGMEKPETRRLAREKGLPVFDKPDSYEICFVPDNDYRGFLERRAPEAFHAGQVLNRDGRVIGEHPGHQHYTIGQRRGLSVTLGHPIYVVDKDPAANTITVGEREALLAEGLLAGETNWLIEPPAEPMRCAVKIRSNSPPVPGAVWATGPDELELRFDEPQSAVTPGQAVACYVGEELVGGGWIRGAVRAMPQRDDCATARQA